MFSLGGALDRFIIKQDMMCVLLLEIYDFLFFYLSTPHSMELDAATSSDGRKPNLVSLRAYLTFDELCHLWSSHPTPPHPIHRMLVKNKSFLFCLLTQVNSEFKGGKAVKLNL